MNEFPQEFLDALDNLVCEKCEAVFPGDHALDMVKTMEMMMPSGFVCRECGTANKIDVSGS